jgi:hypothetical protein
MPVIHCDGIELVLLLLLLDEACNCLAVPRLDTTNNANSLKDSSLQLSRSIA